MVAPITLHASILDGLGGEINDRIFHPSGWTAPGDTDTGISFGEGLEVGVGYMRMDVTDTRSGAGTPYTLRGLYGEVGVGLGEGIKNKAASTAAGRWALDAAKKVSASKFASASKPIIEKINKYLRKPQTDGIYLPGGSITPFMMGPFMTRGSLEATDFKNATMVYVYIEGSAGLGVDIGIMIMVNPLLLSVTSILPGGQFNLLTLLAVSTAWAPYWGMDVSLSLDVKVTWRLIQDVQMVPYSTFPL
jgi:hypothetical protein